MLHETPEVLQQLQALEKQLQTLGVKPENMVEAAQLIHDYAQLQTDLAYYRENQFMEAARDLIYKSSGRTNKIENISMYLRKFAEHVAGHVVGRGQWVPKDNEGHFVTDLVDRIPPMPEQTEQETK